MPKNQKILLIVLVVVVAYFVNVYFIAGDNGETTPGTVQSGTTAGQPSGGLPAVGEPVQGTQDRGAGQRRAGAGSGASGASIKLEWVSDPFFREPPKVAAVTDTTGQVDRLTGLKYTSFAGIGERMLLKINNTYFEVGDIVNGLKIISGNDKYVELEENGKKYYLYISR